MEGSYIMIVYTARCLACSNKPLHRKLNEYAIQNKVKYEIRRTNLSKDFREEAESYGVPLPFVVIDGAAKRIEDL